MLNFIQKGSYIRPHRHWDPPKSETVLLMQGGLRCVIFDGDGSIAACIGLSRASGRWGVDIRPGVFHTLVATEADTVIFEAKTGPYVESTDKDFAEWAPIEGADGATAYQEWLRREISI
jgi:cupin fold WbuC family metalloprotein